MLCLVDTGFKRFERILFVNGDDFGGEHGTFVHAFIGDEMNHDACVVDLAALVGFEGAFDGMGTRECVGQGGVNVDDFVGEG